MWRKASPLCEISAARTRQCPAFAITTTAEGVTQLKDLLLKIYQEQLNSRPRPSNRSQQSFQSILATSYRACENRLAELHTVPGIWAFASKCLREREWKDRFQSEGAEICSSNCISQELQHTFVNATEEAPDFEKSLDLTLQVFSVSLKSDVKHIDLDQPAVSEPQSGDPSGEPSAFNIPLRSADAVVDLD